MEETSIKIELENSENIDLLLIEFFNKDAHISINKNLAKTIGILEAYLFCELISKYKYFKDKLINGWFFNTSKNIEEDTGLSYFQQKRIITKLSELKLIETKIAGVPAKQYFKINSKETLMLVLEKLKNLHTEKLKNLYNKNNIIRIINKSSKDDYMPPVGTITSSKQPKNHTSSIYLEKWNSLQNVRKHKSPNSKTYQKAVKYLSQLFQGTFLQDKIIDQDWWIRCKIPDEFKNKRWSRIQLLEGIEHLGKMFLDGYWPEDKSMLPKSLPDLLYNSRTEKSWFLKVMASSPTITGKNPSENKYPELVNLITNQFNIPSSEALKKNVASLVEFNKNLYRSEKKEITVSLSVNKGKIIERYFPLDKPEYLLNRYIKFLITDWRQPIHSSLFKTNSFSFQKWIEKMSEEIGIHIITGKTLE